MGVFNAAQHTAGDAPCQHNHAFALGKDVAGIIFGGNAVEFFEFGHAHEVSAELQRFFSDNFCVPDLLPFKFIGAAAAGELIAGVEHFAIGAQCPDRTLAEFFCKTVADLIFQCNHTGSAAGGGVTVDRIAAAGVFKSPITAVGAKI